MPGPKPKQFERAAIPAMNPKGGSLRGAWFDAYLNAGAVTILRSASYDRAFAEWAEWQSRMGTCVTEDDFERFMANQRASNRPRSRFEK